MPITSVELLGQVNNAINTPGNHGTNKGRCNPQNPDAGVAGKAGNESADILPVKELTKSQKREQKFAFQAQVGSHLTTICLTPETQLNLRQTVSKMPPLKEIAVFGVKLLCYEHDGARYIVAQKQRRKGESLDQAKILLEAQAAGGLNLNQILGVNPIQIEVGSQYRKYKPVNGVELSFVGDSSTPRVTSTSTASVGDTSPPTSSSTPTQSSPEAPSSSTPASAGTPASSAPTSPSSPALASSSTSTSPATTTISCMSCIPSFRNFKPGCFKSDSSSPAAPSSSTPASSASATAGTPTSSSTATPATTSCTGCLPAPFKFTCFKSNPSSSTPASAGTPASSATTTKDVGTQTSPLVLMLPPIGGWGARIGGIGN